MECFYQGRSVAEAAARLGVPVGTVTSRAHYALRSLRMAAGRDGGDGMRCEHEHDDGAYVLGALSPAERAAYERHLATCSFCREAVADIAVLPGLLGRLDAADFAKLLDPTLVASRQPNRTPDLVSAAQTTRRRERKHDPRTGAEHGARRGGGGAGRRRRRGVPDGRPDATADAARDRPWR